MAKYLPISFRGVDTDHIMPGQFILADHWKTMNEDANWLIANRRSSYFSFPETVVYSGTGATEINRWRAKTDRSVASAEFYTYVTSFVTSTISNASIIINLSNSDATLTTSYNINVTSTGWLNANFSIPWQNDLIEIAIKLEPPQENVGVLGISTIYMGEKELTLGQIP